MQDIAFMPKSPCLHILFLVKFLVLSIIFLLFSSFFLIFFKKILNEYFYLIYKYSQVYYIIIYPLNVILMIRLACFVSQSSKCKNFRILFGEVAASLSAYVQF